MTLNNPHSQHSVKTATASAELDFSGGESPSSKFTLNINAFNGNKTNFGGKCNGNK
jgi:hypothetical protein